MPEFGLAEGVADLNLAFHVMNDHVHVGHGPGAGLVFLAVEADGTVAILTLLVEYEAALDEQAGGAAAGVVHVHARLGIHDAGHNEGYLGGSIELARALA